MKVQMRGRLAAIGPVPRGPRALGLHRGGDDGEQLIRVRHEQLRARQEAASANR